MKTIKALLLAKSAVTCPIFQGTTVTTAIRTFKVKASHLLHQREHIKCRRLETMPVLSPEDIYLEVKREKAIERLQARCLND